ncbi:MAG: DUF882 domain-containing protein [Bacteroidales bacterium]|nr:DUF882 domain-containing protein [Bacteroidales bacterium]MCF8343018.1 DUF882 domain-containing protein [Bacteroidales bacterium]MCF8350258.1 DUF882 domain-containing protein [Bacteroidales bacterium]MCF8375990.1 DUF882 domain-containing protein [Bacteroidales bacterium]MCF8400478.1 DUF882 domain-containing protein [Bacteroidales bacterium]
MSGKKVKGRKILKRAGIVLAAIILLAVVFFFVYCNSLLWMDEQAKSYYTELKEEVEKQGYETAFFVLCGKRFELINNFLAKYGSAVKKSTHLEGKAIDILVLDVNNDGNIDGKDVDIVYQILDRKIVKDNGGIGTYKNQDWKFTRQMVHFDCRGHRKRWHK